MPRSEQSKMPRVKTGEPRTPEERQKTQRERAAAKAQAPAVRVEHKVPDAERPCTVCGNEKLNPLGEGKTTTVSEFVPARFVRVEQDARQPAGRRDALEHPAEGEAQQRQSLVYLANLASLPP